MTKQKAISDDEINNLTLTERAKQRRYFQNVPRQVRDAALDDARQRAGLPPLPQGRRLR